MHGQRRAAVLHHSISICSGSSRSSSAVAFVTRKSPVAAALWLVNTMFCLAALYVLLDAQFIGAIQVLVYAGAIMVVFLFVIMLLNLGQAVGHRRRARDWVEARGGARRARRCSREIFALTARADACRQARRCRTRLRWRSRSPVRARSRRSPGRCSTSTLLAFEVTSVLLLAAIVGAVVLGKRKERATCSLRRSFFSAVLFTIGVIGVLTRRNAIIVFMCVELMLNAVNLTFVALSRRCTARRGQVFVFFVMTVAAAEAAVGLAIIIALFRHRQTVDLQNINLLKG